MKPKRLNADQVRELKDVWEQRQKLMRQLRKLPSSEDLAKKYGIARTNIYQIVKGLIYKDMQ